ncbi:MAG: AarF/UbiB family protein [Myxococcota bacterium]
MLLIRLLRALAVVARITGSYALLLALRRVFRRRDAEGRPIDPPWLVRRTEATHARNARRLRDAMLRFRGVFIKLGQVLSIMGGFLPRVYGRELESLQDDVPPRPFAELRPAFRSTLGQPPEAFFAHIDEAPLAAASLGQVHRARAADGRALAVKILYPGIRRLIRVDLNVIRLALWIFHLFVPLKSFDRVYVSLVDLLRRETDYLHEAECMRRVAANFAHVDDVLVPEVIAEATSKDVLTMTFMEGVKITDYDAMASAGIDREAVARRLVQCFYKQLFVDRFFHADPHPGNFLVQPGARGDAPRLVILDYGAICEVSEATIDGLVDVMRGFLEGQDALVVRGIDRIGFVATGGHRELLEKTVRTYFRKLLKVDRTAAAFMRASGHRLLEIANPEVEMSELRPLMKTVEYPDGWFYVERASILMFWLVGQIAPELDTIQVGFPYVMPLLADRIAKEPGAVRPPEPPAVERSAAIRGITPR